MAFTNAEEEAIRMLCRNAAQTGVDEGIRAAAAMIRKAHDAGFPGSLLDLASLVESSASTGNNPNTPNPAIIPKPQPSGGRLIIEDRWSGGYQPRRSGDEAPDQPPQFP